jgi:hypothetical protein
VDERILRTWKNVSSVHYNWKKREVELYSREGIIDRVKGPWVKLLHVDDVEIDTRGFPNPPGIDFSFSSPATCTETERYWVLCYVPERIQYARPNKGST